MRHGRTCPNCGSSVTPEQITCRQCNYRFSSRDEDEEEWDPDDVVSLTEKGLDFDEDSDDEGGGVIMEDDPNAERESFDGEQEDDWDDEDWEEDDGWESEDDPEGGGDAHG